MATPTSDERKTDGDHDQLEIETEGDVVTYSLADVREMGTGGRIVFAVSGIVLDCTDFKDHPGGIEYLEEVTGTDATNLFLSIGHSPRAMAMFKRWQIGVLEESAEPEKILPRVQFKDLFLGFLGFALLVFLMGRYFEFCN